MNYKRILQISLAVCLYHAEYNAHHAPNEQDKSCWPSRKGKGNHKYSKPSEQKGSMAPTSSSNTETVQQLISSAQPPQQPPTYKLVPLTHSRQKKSDPHAHLQLQNTPKAHRPPPPPPPRTPRPAAEAQQQNPAPSPRKKKHRRNTRHHADAYLRDAGLLPKDTVLLQPTVPVPAAPSVHALLESTGLASTPSSKNSKSKTPTHRKNVSSNALLIPKTPGSEAPTPYKFFARIMALEQQLFPPATERQVFEINENTIPIMDSLVNYADTYKFLMAKNGADLQELQDLDQQSHAYRLAIHNFRNAAATAKAISKSALQQMQKRTFILEARKSQAPQTDDPNEQKDEQVTLTEILKGGPPGTTADSTTETETEEHSHNSASSESSIASAPAQGVENE